MELLLLIFLTNENVGENIKNWQGKRSIWETVQTRKFALKDPFNFLMYNKRNIKMNLHFIYKSYCQTSLVSNTFYTQMRIPFKMSGLPSTQIISYICTYNSQKNLAMASVGLWLWHVGLDSLAFHMHCSMICNSDFFNFKMIKML